MQTSQEEKSPDMLKGWRQIADFLGQPLAVSQRWAHAGMPVERQGRFVYASRQKLQDWLHREASGEPVQIVSEDTDLTAQLKRGLSYAHKAHHKKPGRAA
jgi:hypothetical protein